MYRPIIFFLFLSFTSFAQNEKIELYKPTSLVVDSKDNIFVGDKNLLYKITPEGKATEFLNSRNLSMDLELEFYKIAIDQDDNIYSIGQSDCIILKIAPNGKVINYVGNPRYSYDIKDDKGSEARFSSLQNISIDKNKTLYVIDNSESIAKKDKNYKPNVSHVFRTIDKNLNVKTIKQANSEIPMWFEITPNLAPQDDGRIVYGALYAINSIGKDGLKKIAGQPQKAYAVYNKGKAHYVKFILGDTTKAEFMNASHIINNKKGELVFVHYQTLRILKLPNGVVSHLAGGNDISCYLQVQCGSAEPGFKDGNAKAALFSRIDAIAYDTKGNLIILDTGNKAIRKLSPDGVVSTLFK
jgi:hypothetical protein